MCMQSWVSHGAASAAGESALSDSRAVGLVDVSERAVLKGCRQYVMLVLYAVGQHTLSQVQAPPWYAHW
jgi:hypothetical protein